MLINGKGNKQRTVYFEKKAAQALKSYLKDRTSFADQHIFLNYQGAGLSQQGVADIVEKYRKADKKGQIARILEHVATFFRQKGHFVKTLPYSLI